MKLMFLGLPGAGKGTQSAIVSRDLRIPVISTGAILRSAVRNETPVGKKAKAFMDAGKLVPDDVIIGILEERLAMPDCADGYILDGVPRTIAQAESLEKAGIQFDAAISLELSDAEVEARITGRRTCNACGASYHVVSNPPVRDGICDQCGEALVQRDDDTPEMVRARLEVYHRETEPLKGFYESRGILRMVVNQKTIELTTKAVMDVLGTHTSCTPC